MVENRDGADAAAVSDGDRQQVAERLTEAVGEGRLTLHEFAQRVELAYAASTTAELDTVLGDLPQQRDQPSAAPEVEVAAVAAQPEKRPWKLAIMGGAKYHGRWRVAARSGFFALMGGCNIDLSQAVLETEQIDVTLVSIMGGNKVTVPRGVRVVVNDTDVMGGTQVRIDEEAVAPNAPVVRVRAYSIMGGNKITHGD